MDERTRGYLWAELGALGGAVVTGVPAGVAWGGAILPFLFSADGWYLVMVSGLALAVAAAGAAFGCRWALRRKGLPAAERTAVVLAALLTLLYLIGLWSSDTWLQSDLLPYLTAVAPLTPLSARWLAQHWL
jgi:hypothetical protein